MREDECLCRGMIDGREGDGQVDNRHTDGPKDKYLADRLINIQYSRRDQEKILEIMDEQRSVLE